MLSDVDSLESNLKDFLHVEGAFLSSANQDCSSVRVVRIGAVHSQDDKLEKDDVRRVCVTRVEQPFVYYLTLFLVFCSVGCDTFVV